MKRKGNIIPCRSSKIILRNLRMQIEGLEISTPERSKLTSIVDKLYALRNIVCKAVFLQGTQRLNELFSLIRK